MDTAEATSQKYRSLILDTVEATGQKHRSLSDCESLDTVESTGQKHWSLSDCESVDTVEATGPKVRLWILYMLLAKGIGPYQTVNLWIL